MIARDIRDSSFASPPPDGFRSFLPVRSQTEDNTRNCSPRVISAHYRGRPIALVQAVNSTSIEQSRRSPIMPLLRSVGYSTRCSARWDSSLAFGFATEGPSLTRQEFAEECDINVLMAYGRCLRPALYSSLRSSPSHPTGVSALRVTIAIANARFARKQWGASQVNCQSRGGSFAMNRPPADVFGQALLNDPPQ